MAFQIGGGNLTESQTKSFSKDCIIYAINIDPSPKSDGHFEGNFLQLWKVKILPFSVRAFIRSTVEKRSENIRGQATYNMAIDENSERKQENFVCVECGLKSDEIYKEFKGGSFKLCICVSTWCIYDSL